MPKALFFSYPAYGHILPALSLVQELIQRQEEVICFSSERFQPLIEKTGAKFLPYPFPENDFSPNPPTEGIFFDMDRLLRLSHQMLPFLLEVAEKEKPDYLIMDTKGLWGNLLQQILNLPSITVSVVFAIRKELIDVPTLLKFLLGNASKDRILRGMSKLESYFGEAQKLKQTYHVQAPGIIDFLGNPQQLKIVFTSKEFQLAGEKFDESYHFVGPSLTGRKESETWPEDFHHLHSAPIIYISLGTVFNHDVNFYKSCMEAFAQEKANVVMNVGGNIDIQALGQIPANFLIKTSVPQLKLLEQSTLHITHGGMNGVNEALFFGVPLVVIPQRGDQYLVASRVEELGLGLKINPHEVTASKLLEASRKILSTKSYSQKAAQMASSLQQAGGSARGAKAILNFLQGQKKN